MNKMNKINPINVDPNLWGPLFWLLLNTIAKYSGNMPSNMNDTLKTLIDTIPYVLPCPECAYHCAEIYRLHQMTHNVSLSTFKVWVWKLKTEVNKYTNTPNIGYEKYLYKLQEHSYSISRKQYFNLLAYISFNYPYDYSSDSVNKRNNVFLFVKSTMQLLTYVPTSSLGKLAVHNVWNNKIEFQDWLAGNCYKLYNHHINFDKLI
jgi:hypothetical protein